ncbi:hypothetical protein CsSME_00008599 [Camellia sinensis var. sinensis]
MIPCIVLAGPIGLGFGYMRQIENLVVLTLKNVNVIVLLEKRLLYDFVIMDEHFKGQRYACVLLPAAARNNQSGLCTHCLFY